jgi:chromosome segregation ATPase
MSTLDELPSQLEVVLDHTRTVVGREIEKARKLVDALNAEKTVVTKAVADLKEQLAQVKKQLDAVHRDLHQRSTLAEIRADIEKARKTLEELQADIELATAAKAAADKERTDAERRLKAAMSGLQDIRAERADHEASIGQIRTLLKSFEVRKSP